MDDDLLTVRAAVVNFHVLRDSDELYLIDTGFVAGQWLLQRALRRKGWDRFPIRGILLTHGHLDHILNTAPIARATGAWIAAPRLDCAHYAGTPTYRGMAKVTGLLETTGRFLLRFEPFTPERWIKDGTTFDIWHGLRAIHLPGHTEGHTGYYCERLRLLFSADLFSSYFGNGQLPPAIFNSEPEQISASIGKALQLGLGGVIPNHGDKASPGEHLQRLRRLHNSAARA